MEHGRLTNGELADLLDRVSELLHVQGAGPHRERAWHQAARRIRGHHQPVWDVAVRGGLPALEAIPTIGPGIAAAIDELVHTGHLRTLDRLEGDLGTPEAFTLVPGIGPALAGRIQRELGIGTLEDLEIAAHDGRLATVRGFGARRVEVVRALLAERLGRRTEWRAPAATGVLPTVRQVLEVDTAYRRRAAQGSLPTIAPRRFNPHGDAWLPVLHAHGDGWDFTALFSNTPRAHQLGRAHDWVVIYFDRGRDAGQHTVVTERRGPLAGRRVIRGREEECARHYAAISSAA